MTTQTNVQSHAVKGHHSGWLSRERLQQEAEQLKKTGYGQYLLNLLAKQ